MHGEEEGKGTTDRREERKGVRRGTKGERLHRRSAD